MIAALVFSGFLGAVQAAQPAPTTGTLTGQVVEEGTHAPIADARVTLLPASRPPVPGPPPQTTTDAQGRFVFNALDPGLYRVQAQKSGYAVQLSGPDTPPRPSITVAAGQTSQAPSIVLERGGAISGRVLDPSGQPLVDARVSALRRISPQAAPQSMLVPAGQSAQTNDLGEFRVFGLPSGTYFVEAGPRPDVGPPGIVVAARTTLLAPTYFPATPDQRAAQPVEVTAGQTTPDIQIQMVVVAAFTVSGVVVDDSGAPVADAMLMVMPDRSLGGMPMTFGPPARIRTDAAGMFTVPNLMAGVYQISAAVPVTVAAGSGPSSANASGVGVVSGGGFGVGGAGGFSMTEMRNGVVTQYRGDPSGAVRVTIATESVSGVRVVVHRAQ